MRKVTVENGKLVLSDAKVECFYEKQVTRFGTSGKIDCPKRFIGRRAYVVVCKR